MGPDTTVFVIGPEETLRKSVVATLSSTRMPFAEFAGIRDFLGTVPSDARGCVIATFDPFAMHGFDWLAQVKETLPTLPVILVARQLSIRMVVTVLKEGAQTVLEAPVPHEDLFFAVREGMKENELRTQKAVQLASLRSQFERISAGEQRVLELLCDGMTNREIAARLDIHVRTVEARKQRLLKKASCKSVPQLLLSFQRYKDSITTCESYLNALSDCTPDAASVTEPVLVRSA